MLIGNLIVDMVVLVVANADVNVEQKFTPREYGCRICPVFFLCVMKYLAVSNFERILPARLKRNLTNLTQRSVSSASTGVFASRLKRRNSFFKDRKILQTILMTGKHLKFHLHSLYTVVQVILPFQICHLPSP